MNKAEIDAVHARWLEAFNGGDAAGVAACYTEDARFMPPNLETITGRAGIEAFVKEFIAANAHLDFEQVALHDTGDLGVFVGRYELDVRPDGADPQHDSGKFIEVWTRQPDGSWLMVDDIFNSRLPLPS
jgi:uncharacterized protein (TIGR02246 family)